MAEDQVVRSSVLRVRELSVGYGKNPILKNLSLELAGGELVTLLGPNGAGKSTFIKVLLGLLPYQKGEVSVCGYLPGQLATRRQLGCAPQASEFPEKLTPHEILSFVCSISRGDLSELVQKFELQSFLEQPSKTLSGGQRRALGLACAFAGQPQLVVLDEPTVGLDAEVRRSVWRQIKGFLKSGGSVLLTTHHLEEAEELSDRILVLNKGEILTSGTPTQIKSQLGFKRVRYSRAGVKSEHLVSESDKFVRELCASEFQNLEVMSVSLEEAFVKIIRGET